LIWRHIYLEHRLDDVDAFLVLDSDARAVARAGDSHGVTADEDYRQLRLVSVDGLADGIGAGRRHPRSRAAIRAPIPKYHHRAIEADPRVCCDLIPGVSLWTPEPPHQLLKRS
jgi:hypothetical protein